jgi:hypothetical protein
MAYFLVEIRTVHLPQTSLERYCNNNLLSDLYIYIFLPATLCVIYIANIYLDKSCTKIVKTVH